MHPPQYRDLVFEAEVEDALVVRLLALRKAERANAIVEAHEHDRGAAFKAPGDETGRVLHAGTMVKAAAERPEEHGDF